MRAVRQFLRAHRVPLIAVALAALHSLLFWSLGPRVPLGLFLAAVMVSAWHGGMRPAVLATALSVLLLAVIARYQTPGPEEDLVLRLGMFVLVGLIAGYLSQQCRQAIRAVEQVHDILGGSGLAIISADGDGRVTSLNPLARTLTGLGEAEAHGRPLGQVLPIVHGPARQPIPLPPAGTAQELPDGALLIGPGGTDTPVEGTVGPVRDGDGRSAGLMVVFREAGGRLQAAQELQQRADRFRALAGYAPSGLMVLDAEGRCVFSNPAAQAACACGADEALGEGWSRHVQPQDRDRLISDWLRAVVSKQPFADEFRVVTGPGPTRWLRVRSAPMLADGGEVLGHVAALEEVTGRRQTEAALADARRASVEHLQAWAASEKKTEEAVQAARDEAEGRLQEATAARAAAEETARKLQRQLDERGTMLRRAEEALAAARAEAEQSLASARAEFEKGAAEALAGRKHAEEAAGQLREEVRRLSAKRGASEEEVRAATLAVRDAWREEVEAVVAMHLDARAQLAAELTGHREALQTTRDAHDRLQAALVEKDGTAASLKNELARLEQEAGATRQAHDRLQALLAERGGNEDALRKELERLGEDTAAVRQSHDRLQALLAEKERGEASLREDVARLQREAAEVRESRDRHQAALAQKGGVEESLRAELVRAAREADGAREVHDRLQAALADKGKTEEALRREKEFLEGVIDGSPAGIFAHDRDGRCRVWNAALERLLGRPRADALGRTAHELFPPADANGRHATDEAPAVAMDGDRIGLPVGAVIGRSELLETAQAPIHDPAGEVVGGVALVRVLPAPPAPAADNNGAVARPPAVRLGDIDWLAFN
jgi:PAS domain S-box-containing protein